MDHSACHLHQDLQFATARCPSTTPPLSKVYKNTLTYFLQKFIEWFSRQNFSSNTLVDMHDLNHFVILFLNTLTTTAFLNFRLDVLHSLLVDATFLGLFTGQVHANVILETDSALFILDFHIFIQIQVYGLRDILINCFWRNLWVSPV